MKFQNYQRATELVNGINKHKELLEQLKSDCIEIRITIHGEKIMTIGAWPSCEHSGTARAIDFINNLSHDYTQRMQLMLNELETL